MTSRPITTYLFLLTFLALGAATMNAQQSAAFVPLNHHWSQRILANVDSLGHTQMRPLNPFRYGKHLDSIPNDLRWEKPLGRDAWLLNVIFNDEVVDLRRSDFSLRINPLFDVTLGQDDLLTDVSPYQNTRGIALQGQIGHNVAFYTDFVESQTRLPYYVDEWVNDRFRRPQAVIPGMGIPKEFKGEDDQYDFGVASGWFNWQISKIFNAQFGYGKNFVGEGYRSLLLSDNAFNYPYFRFQTRVWKIQYTNLFAQLQDVNSRLSDGTFPRKMMASHYLSVNIGKRLNVGLYETVIYSDSLGTRGLDWAYANPILFYRPIEFAQGSRGGNVIMGLQASYRVNAQLQWYGQFALDEFVLDELRAGDGWWGNKFGVQLGVKGQLENPDLFYRLEFNTVRPYTYGHTTVLQNYAHYNQALAHPLGANFREWVAQLNYYQGRWFAEAQVNAQTQGLDEPGRHWGADVYLSNRDREQDRGNSIGQGIATTNLIMQLRAGWIINPSYNLRLEAGLTVRDFAPELDTALQTASQTTYFYFGLRTPLGNTYQDF